MCIFKSDTRTVFIIHVYTVVFVNEVYSKKHEQDCIYQNFILISLLFYDSINVCFFSTGTIILDRSKNLLNSIESMLTLSSRSKTRNSSWSVTSSKFNETYAERKETKMCAAFVKKKYLEEAKIILQKGRLAN